jgi:gliding motility-associated protein GldM
MSGGKETPRQKMIGMMYLVLTALLALNVSKSILDAFVAIEENIQISNENEYGRGAEKRANLEEVAEDKSVPDVQKKAILLMKTVEAIDKMTAQRIKEIDDMKLEILTTCGEDVAVAGPEKIIFRAYNTKEPLKPIRMKLDHVDAKDKYDEPMLVMGVADDIKNPTGNGINLWNSMNKYRNDLTEMIASSMPSDGKKFFFKAPNVKQYKDIKDLYAQIDKAIKTSNVSMDDQEAIKKIYAALTKNELNEVHDMTGVHWIGKTFDHSPSVAALASLSSLQKEILTARADAVTLIRARVGGGEYSFNKIMALAYGPDIANNGDEVVLEVLMAAYDSDKQPVVVPNQGSLKETKDGKGYVTVKASGASEMVLTGSISIKNKSGVKKTENYTKTIKIMKPEGVVSLPEMLVLYRGYQNVIEGVASGYDKTVLTGSNVTLKPSGKQFIGTPGGGRTATITISGKNTVTNKTVSLGTYTFDVKPMPGAKIFWGQYTDGSTATSRTATTLYAKFDEGIPLKASFAVKKWVMSITGAPKVVTGTGDKLSQEAMMFLSQAKKGTMVSFSCIYDGTGANNRSASCAVQL